MRQINKSSDTSKPGLVNLCHAVSFRVDTKLSNQNLFQFHLHKVHSFSFSIKGIIEEY